jgi:hypothetical protein
MKFLTEMLSSVALLAALGALASAADAGDYLTKDGTLKEPLEIKDVQGGVVGFTGKAWAIESSGDWKLFKVVGEKTEVEQKGTLSKDQLAALAKELARDDLAGLLGKTEGKPTVNPHVVTIKWAKKEAILNLGPGEVLPKPDATTVPGRFAGIVPAVADLAKAPPK